MPITYAYDAARNRVETECEGEVRLVDVVNHFHVLNIDRTVAAHADVLLDITRMVSNPESIQVKTAVDQLERIARQRPFGRCAIVAEGERTRATAGMFQALAAEHFVACRIFADRLEAANWLDQTTR
jgi:hypothetical protein